MEDDTTITGQEPAGDAAPAGETPTEPAEGAAATPADGSAGQASAPAGTPEGGQKPPETTPAEVPDWVQSFVAGEPYSEPAQTPPQPYAQPTAPPAAPAAPTQPATAEPAIDLEAFIQDPQGAIARAAEAKVAPLQEAVQTMAAIMQQQVQATANAELGRARETVETAYKEIFPKDRYYTGDPKVKARVDSMLKSVVQSANQAAMNGDFTMARHLQDPRTMQVVLAMARIAEGKPLDAAQAAAMTDGTTVAGVATSPTQPQGNITQDEIEACKAAGVSVEEYIKQRDEADKYNAVY